MSLLKEKIEVAVGERELKLEQKFSQFAKPVKWFVILGLLAIIPGYLIAKALAHNYWQKKLSIFLIKAKPSFTNAKMPTVSKIEITTLGPGNYSAVAAVLNPNLDLSLKEARYRFDFFGSQGQKLYSETKKFFLLPNQTKYLVATSLNSPEQIVSASLTFLDELPWQKKISIPQVKLLTSSPATYNQLDPLAFVAEGSVANTSPYNLKSIRITFLLFDSANKVIGVSQRDEFHLKPAERRSYKQLWPNIYSTDVAKAQVLAETNTLDSNNLSLPQEPVSPASNLDRPENQSK